MLLSAPSPAFRPASSSCSSPASLSAVDACVNMNDSRRSASSGRPPFLTCKATDSAMQFWCPAKTHHQHDKRTRAQQTEKKKSRAGRLWLALPMLRLWFHGLVCQERRCGVLMTSWRWSQRNREMAAAAASTSSIACPRIAKPTKILSRLVQNMIEVIGF